MNKDDLIRATFLLFILLLPFLEFVVSGDATVLWLYAIYAASIPVAFIAGHLAHKVYRENFYTYADATWGSFNRELTNDLKKYEWRGFEK